MGLPQSLRIRLGNNTHILLCLTGFVISFSDFYLYPRTFIPLAFNVPAAGATKDDQNKAKQDVWIKQAHGTFGGKLALNGFTGTCGTGSGGLGIVGVAVA